MTPPADLHIGAFSDDAPWLVVPEDMPWRLGIDQIRRRVRAEVPRLIRKRRLPPGLRVLNVSARFGRAFGMWAMLERGKPASRAAIAKRSRSAMEDLGAAYIKLAQIIASGEGLFPTELVEECKKCRDQVAAEPIDVVRRTVEEELGMPLSTVFSSFTVAPIAAASIAQVHGATLLDGSEVVVKVQRSTVAQNVHRDLKVLGWLSPFLVGRIPVASLANPPALVEVFAETIVEELDFRLEAQNMLDIAASLVALNQRGYVIPRPHPTLVTRRLLVMERLEGFAFDDVIGMAGAGIDTSEIIRTGMIAFMEGALVQGVFHGDLHTGNLLVLPDGRTGLLDFGITGRLSDQRRIAFLRLMITATMSDLHGQLGALRDLGALPSDTDIDEVIAELGLDGPALDPTKLSQEELLDELQAVVKSLLAFGARLPKELMLFVKNMVFLDNSIATLAPDLDLLEEITRVAMFFASTHGSDFAAQIGMDPNTYEVDLDSVKNAFGLDQSTERFTYADLKSRRELIRRRLTSDE